MVLSQLHNGRCVFVLALLLAGLSAGCKFRRDESKAKSAAIGVLAPYMRCVTALDALESPDKIAPVERTRRTMLHGVLSTEMAIAVENLMRHVAGYQQLPGQKLDDAGLSKLMEDFYAALSVEVAKNASAFTQALAELGMTNVTIGAFWNKDKREPNQEILTLITTAFLSGKAALIPGTPTSPRVQIVFAPTGQRFGTDPREISPPQGATAFTPDEVIKGSARALEEGLLTLIDRDPAEFRTVVDTLVAGLVRRTRYGESYGPNAGASAHARAQMAEAFAAPLVKLAKMKPTDPFLKRAASLATGAVALAFVQAAAVGEETGPVVTSAEVTEHIGAAYSRLQELTGGTGVWPVVGNDGKVVVDSSSFDGYGEGAQTTAELHGQIIAAIMAAQERLAGPRDSTFDVQPGSTEPSAKVIVPKIENAASLLGLLSDVRAAAAQTNVQPDVDAIILPLIDALEEYSYNNPERMMSLVRALRAVLSDPALAGSFPEKAATESQLTQLETTIQATQATLAQMRTPAGQATDPAAYEKMAAAREQLRGPLDLLQNEARKGAAGRLAQRRIGR